jgi:ribose transport system substrate-binding protein
MIMGAVEALKAAGKNDQVWTIGMGMYAGGPEAIKAGDLDASWELYPAGLGKIAGEVALKLSNGEEVPAIYNTPMDFVTKDNIDQFLAPAEAETLEPFIVGYAAAGLIDAVQLAWSEGLNEVVEAAGGTVITLDSQNKIDKQVADVEDLLAQGVDYLVINPVDEAGIVPAIEAANKAGVPVITIDRAAGGGEVTSHITFDNYKAGYDAGIYCAEQTGGTGEVAQLEGMAGTSVARERAQGYKDAIAKYPDMQIVFEQPADWDTAKALSATEDMLASNPDVVCIWAHADAMIMGAVEALKAAGKNDQVWTIGMGMYAGGPEAIKAGDLDASWELYPAGLGKIAGEVALKLSNGEEVPAIYNTPMDFVTKDNIDEYLK